MNNVLFIRNIFITQLFVLTIFFLGCNTTDSGEEEKKDRPIRFTNELISDQLEYPWQMAFTNDSRIFVSEIKGTVRVFKDDNLMPEPWFDLNTYLEKNNLRFPEDVSGIQRSGLQGIAIDPEFDDNQFVYLGFAYKSDGKDYDFNRLLRLKENTETNKGYVDKVLLDSVPGFNLHQAAQIKFGPDDKLYWSVGDRFEVETAQDLNDLSGSILRLNRDGTIPNDNPFVDSYIYSYGHRNPQGFSWHPETGMMVATEHGPSSSQGCCRDEINIIESGKNYGWPIIAGDETSPNMESPLLHSGNEPSNGGNELDSTWAPSGATFIKSGPWKNSFLFAGLRSKTLWKLNFDEDNNVEELISVIDTQKENYHRARSVDQAPDGSIYLITSNMDRTYNPEYGRRDYLVKINVFYEQ